MVGETEKEKGKAFLPRRMPANKCKRSNKLRKPPFCKPSIVTETGRGNQGESHWSKGCWETGQPHV